MYSEEVELDGRDAEQDYLQFKESCDSLATLMSEIQDLKANGAKEGVRVIPFNIYLLLNRVISLLTLSHSHVSKKENDIKLHTCDV